MTSPRNWLLSTPNLASAFNPKSPTLFTEEVYPTIDKVWSDSDISSVEDFNLVKVRILLIKSSHNELRAIRTDIINEIKKWAGLSGVPGQRGFRTYALRRPVFNQNRDNPNQYGIFFDVLLSQRVNWSAKRYTDVNYNLALNERNLADDLKRNVRAAFLDIPTIQVDEVLIINS